MISEWRRQFYLAGLLVLLWFWPDTLRAAATHGEVPWLWLCSWLSFTSVSALLPVYFATLSSFMFCAFGPNWRAPRLMAAALFTTCLAAIQSVGVLDYDAAIWCWALFALGLFRLDRPASIMAAVRTVSLLLPATIASAGIWKLRALIAAFESPDFFARIPLVLPNHIAEVALKGGQTFPHLSAYLLDWPTLSASLWLGLMLFELAFVAPVVWPRFMTAGLIAALTLHTVVRLAVGIFFFPQMLIILVLLQACIAPPASSS